MVEGYCMRDLWCAETPLRDINIVSKVSAFARGSLPREG